MTKTVKVKKLTAKTALIELLAKAEVMKETLSGNALVYGVTFTQEWRDRVEVLLAPKPKKSKLEVVA